ncbi:MAG: TIGR04219 family outer membrane beta-barrel protein [Proteobacteria bacterium]|nr:TIGR04219 family outer membrane beta-barrel protein [Pseudomonadota bacterium]MBU1737374.1 TIGR04219 family outer membrane beta-barrel protein [Pseudomonadota bacterium]
MVAVVVVGMSGNASALGLEISAGGWAQSPDGQLAYKSLATTDSLDLENDARYDEETQALVRVKIDMPAVIPNIYLMASPMEFEGAGQKTTAFDFGDIQFDASIPFTSRISLDHYDLALYYGIPLLGTASLNTLNIDLGINVRMIDIEAEINQPTVGKRESIDETLYVPMAFLAVQITPIEELSIEAEARGVGYSGSHYYDFIGRIKYKFAGPVFAAAGYRHEEIEIDEKDIRAEVDFSGPFAEAGFQF